MKGKAVLWKCGEDGSLRRIADAESFNLPVLGNKFVMSTVELAPVERFISVVFQTEAGVYKLEIGQ